MSAKNPNASERGNETLTEKKKNGKGTLGDFIKSSVKDYLGYPVDPHLLNKYIKKGGKDEIIDSVITASRGVRYDNPDLYSEISEDMLDRELIDTELQLQAQPMLLLRKKAFQFALDTAPNLDKWGANWKEHLETEISLQKNSELSNILMNKGKMRAFLKKNFKDLEILSSNEAEEFKKVFHDYESVTDETSKKRLFAILQNKERYGQNISSDDLAFILDVYQNAAPNRLKELLIGLRARFTVDFAIEKKLINKNEVENILTELYGDAYSGLKEEKKELLRTSLRNLKDPILTGKNFDITHLSALFTDRVLRKELKDHIEESVITAQESSNVLEKDPTITQKLVQNHNKKVADARENGEDMDENFDMYDAFLDHIGQLKKNDGRPVVTDVEKLREEGSLIKFTSSEHGSQFIRIKKVRSEDGSTLEIKNETELGIDVELLSIVNNELVKSVDYSLSYDELLKVMAKLGDATGVRKAEYDALFTENKLTDKRNLISDPITKENIKDKIDLLDESGKEFGFEKGTYFIVTEEGTDVIWSVNNLTGDTVDLMAPNGYVLKGVKLDQFYEALESNTKFERIGKIENDETFIKALASSGVGPGSKIDGGKLLTKTNDEHGHEEEKEITCFSSEKGGHIRLDVIKDGIVYFGEFDPGENKTEDVKAHAEKHGLDNKVKNQYKWRRMSYPSFLEYLEKNKLRASEKDVIVPDAHDHSHHEHYHAHTHGSFWSKLMKLQNPASIMKGFELFYHSIEHTLEKGSKLDAARFAMGTAKFLGLDETSIGAQVYADITTASKEIVEKYEQKIFGLPGPAGRWKALHIVHNLDSRPEEVVAAMNYMLKSYGHLYAEDIRKYQSVVNKDSIKNADVGYFAFLDAFIVTTRIGSVSAMRQKAYKKAITEMGSEADHENEPTEEQLIHALMKTVDGNWGDFPYAASVVKAVGGPSGFEKNYKFEGLDNAKKKGLEQTQMVNADGRVNKGLGYFKTHEIYKAIGSMEAVAMKSKSPIHQVLPFLWCVGGYSQYPTHHSLQKIKNYSETAYTFHAYAFMRTYVDNEKYIRGVEGALEDLGGTKAKDEFNSIRKRLKFDPNVKDKDRDEAIEEMAKFWGKWCDKGLHDYLQGHNGKLLKKARSGDNDMHAYLKVLDRQHSQSLNDSNIPSNDLGKDWYDEHGLRMNRIMTYDEKVGLYSFKRTLNKIQLYGTRTGDKEMKTNEYEKLWQGIVEQMQNIRSLNTFDGDEKLQKEQYLYYRNEIIEYFMKQHQAASGQLTNADIERFVSAPHPYLNDLRNMGIDPREIFDRVLYEDRGEADYSNWKSKISSGAISKKRKIPDLEGDIKGMLEDTLELTPGRRARRGVDPTGTMGRDSDLAYRGGWNEASGVDTYSPSHSSRITERIRNRARRSEYEGDDE